MSEILFLAHRVPWPPNRGDKIRSYNMLRQLQQFGPVHIACFADDDEEAALDATLEHRLASQNIVVRTKPQWRAGLEALATGQPISVTSFASAQLQRAVDQIVKQRPISCIFIFSGQMAQFIPAGYKGRVVMDFADVDSAKFESYAADCGLPMSWINAREGRLLSQFEKSIAQRADYSLLVSEAEAELFRQRSGLGSDRILAAGNGIDLDFYNPDIVPPLDQTFDGPLIVFTGQMDYRPNVEAVTSFSQDVMPTILQQYPNARFAIVGRAPTIAVRQLDGVNGTFVTGAVDDVRQWLAAADVVVAPLRIARGIQNKVLEAMAMKKPVVVSTAAAEGIAAQNGEHFLIAANAAHEAVLVNHLLKETAEAISLGLRAGRLMREKYSWDQQLSGLSNICGFASDKVHEVAA